MSGVTRQYWPVALVCIGLAWFTAPVSADLDATLIEAEGHTVTQSEYDFVELVRKATADRAPDLCEQAEGYIQMKGPDRREISAAVARNLCYNGYAKNNQAIDICQKIETASLPEADRPLALTLHDACLYDVQYKREDFDLSRCLAMKQPKSWFFGKCVEKVAAQERNPALCDEHLPKGGMSWQVCQAAAAGKPPPTYRRVERPAPVKLPVADE